MKSLSKPHLIDGKRYALGVVVMVTSWTPLVVYMAKGVGVVYQDLFSPTSASFPLSHLQSTLPPEAWSLLLSQASDLTIKLMLSYEKSVQLAQSRHSARALKGCFEVMQVRFVVSEKLKMKIIDVLPCKWDTNDHFERGVIKTFLCDAISIKGFLEDLRPAATSSEDSDDWFFEEAARHLQSQENIWERLFPLASSYTAYSAALRLASFKTQSLCKLLKTLKIR